MWLRVISVVFTTTLSFLILSACSGGGGDAAAPTPGPTASPSPTPTAQMITIRGIVAAGYAVCDISAEDLSGNVIARATQPSTSDGGFTITVEDYSGPAILIADDCAYDDETTGLFLQDARLMSGIVIDEGQNDTELTVNVTPLSTIALNKLLI